MQTDKYGQLIYTENDICNLMLQDSTRVIKNMLVDKDITFTDMFVNIDELPKLLRYVTLDKSLQEFDEQNQNNWHMPSEYKNLDIAKFILDQCQNEAELQRAGQELLMFQERGMFVLLQYLKYLVDTMRKNNIVWGVGRGSSVASFVLFLIGVHKINSLYYDLPIDEFLK
jgi:DNA polymerase III alpha subunit